MYRTNRQLALMRDGYRCVRCGSTAKLEVHHRVKLRLGGSDAMENLVSLCAGCHHLIERGEGKVKP